MAMNLQSTQMLVPGTGMLPDRNGRYPPVEVGGGNKYTGDWHRGSMHGKGEYEFADGRRWGMMINLFQHTTKSYINAP